MKKNLTLLVCLLLCLGVAHAALRVAAGGVAANALAATPKGRPLAQQPSPSPEQRRTAEPSAKKTETGLSAQERRGKAIYLRGVNASGQEMPALVGELEVPSSTLTCAGCHGTAGEGKTEGGVTAGSLTWRHLVRPEGHTHPTGRKHGAFDEMSFARSVVRGIDPAGNGLLVVMPRYRMSKEELADLVAYLKRIEADRDPGINDTAVRVGTLLPAEGGALAELGGAMRDVLTAYFEDVNRKGGIYNRRVELRFAAAGASPAATQTSLRRLLEDEQVFALVSGFAAGAEKEVADLLQSEEVPLVGPSTLLPQTTVAPVNRQVFYLLGGVREQAGALVNFAARQSELKKAEAAILYADAQLNSEAAASIEEQARRVGWSAVAKRPYEGVKFDAAQTVRALKGEGREVVFFLGSSAAARTFLQTAAQENWTPTIFLLGALSGTELLDAVSPAFKNKVFLAFPSVPSDVTPEGIAEYRALMEKYKFTQRHTAAQLSALAAAKIFVEGLKRTGHELSREKLINALEGLYEFGTALTPPMTFGPNRRIGAPGAYIITIDPDKKQFVVASEWVKAN